MEDKRKLLIRKIEAAFGFRLHLWQKEYLLYNRQIPVDILNARRNGKTTIYIIRLLLSSKEPIKSWDLYKFSDMPLFSYAKLKFPHMVISVHNTLYLSGLNPRSIDPY